MRYLAILNFSQSSPLILHIFQNTNIPALTAATSLKKKLWHGWILRNFKGYLFYRTTPGDCFCNSGLTFLLVLSSQKKLNDKLEKYHAISLQIACMTGTLTKTTCHIVSKLKEVVLNWCNLIRVFLTHFWPMFSFYTPWKHQKTSGFLVFSGGIKWEHWREMG